MEENQETIKKFPIINVKYSDEDPKQNNFRKSQLNTYKNSRNMTSITK